MTSPVLQGEYLLMRVTEAMRMLLVLEGKGTGGKDKEKHPRACLGSLVGWSVIPTGQGGSFDPRLGYIQISTNECINKWNNKLISLSLSNQSINKKYIPGGRDSFALTIQFLQIFLSSPFVSCLVEDFLKNKIKILAVYSRHYQLGLRAQNFNCHIEDSN